MCIRDRYKVKNRSKYKGDPDKVVFRSLWERNAFKWCDDSDNIKSWVSEEVVIPYLYEVDKKYHRYFMDLKITYNSGKTILVEIKPEKETKPPAFNGKKSKRYLTEGMTYVKNMNKWSAAYEYASDRGWGFEIWTENHLAALGILPKPIKKFKPIKPFKVKKRR